MEIEFLAKAKIVNYFYDAVMVAAKVPNIPSHFYNFLERRVGHSMGELLGFVLLFESVMDSGKPAYSVSLSDVKIYDNKFARKEFKKRVILAKKMMKKSRC